ncbi:hypothetical protein DENSPDRAFT_832363 [Dentipellis sp. KUC8613]|nr:hypothetical protein DENSPDRAFT_832363 [Dentipellis sp. KUC8613]
MAARNPPPGFKRPSTNLSPTVNIRRTSERPKGSLPTYARPQPRPPNPPHAVHAPSGYSARSKRRSKGTEGVLPQRSRRLEELYAEIHRDDEEREQLMKWSEDVRQKGAEATQSNLAFFENLVGCARQLEQENKETDQTIAELGQEFQGLTQTVAETWERYHKYDQKFDELREMDKQRRRHIRELQQQMHQSQVRDREFRRERRRIEDEGRRRDQ